MAQKTSKNPLLILAGIVVLIVGIGLGAMELSKGGPQQPGGKEHSTRAGYFIGGAIPLAAILIGLGMGIRVF